MPNTSLNKEELDKEVKRAYEHITSLESGIEHAENFNLITVKDLQHRLDMSKAYASGLQRAEHYFALAEADRDAAVREARIEGSNAAARYFGKEKEWKELSIALNAFQSQPNAKEDSGA